MRFGNSITLRVDQLGQDLKALVNQQQEILVKTQHDSEDISLIVLDLLGSMQFQDVVRKKLNQARGNLVHVVREAVTLQHTSRWLVLENICLTLLKPTRQI